MKDSEVTRLINEIDSNEPGLLKRALANAGISTVMFMQDHGRIPSASEKRKFMFEFLDRFTLKASTWELVKKLRKVRHIEGIGG